VRLHTEVRSEAAPKDAHWMLPRGTLLVLQVRGPQNGPRRDAKESRSAPHFRELSPRPKADAKRKGPTPNFQLPTHTQTHTHALTILNQISAPLVPRPPAGPQSWACPSRLVAGRPASCSLAAQAGRLWNNGARLQQGATLTTIGQWAEGC